MENFTATISWQRGEQAFVDNRYSRRHLWRFDGGAEVPGSSSPHSVPLPMTDATAVDPEEALIAAVSSCHMLWFLSLAAKRKFRVDQYVDEPVGEMGKNSAGQQAMVLITLRPRADFSGDCLPTRDEVEQLHHEAHELCAIAHSLSGEVLCEPVHASP